MEQNFRLMQVKFDLSETLKLHIIFSHYIDHFEVTGETLLECTDETVESVHSKLRSFIESHGWRSTKRGTADSRLKQHKSTVAWNSLNLGDI